MERSEPSAIGIADRTMMMKIKKEYLDGYGKYIILYFHRSISANFLS
jgi:hypothetical protein